MPTRLRTAAWGSFAFALLLHGAVFAALGRWMRIGAGSPVRGVVCCFGESEPDPAPLDAPAPPLAEVPSTEPEPFPDVVRAPDDLLASVDPEPLAAIDPGRDDDSAVDPGDAAFAPATIGIGAWRLGGNVRFGHGPGRASGPGTSAGSGAAVATVAAPPPPPGETRAPRLDVAPEPPVYPITARRRGWEGVVTLRLDVSPAGDVTSVEVVLSSGRDVLDEAAVEAARTWRVTPALADGTAVAGTLDVPVRFRLDS